MSIFDRIKENPKTTFFGIISAIVGLLQVFGVSIPANFAEIFAGGIAAVVLYISKPELNSPTTWIAALAALGALLTWIFGWTFSDAVISAIAQVITFLLALLNKDATAKTPAPATS